MALDFPSFYDGLAVGDIQFSTSETTGATGAPTHVAPNGSWHVDEATGIQYKNTDGATTWETANLTQSQVEAILNTDSHYDPAILRDNTLYANVAAAVTAANIGDSLDGVTIAAGNIIFLDNLTVGQEGSYLVSGSTGAWVFTITTESATPAEGDTILITQGTSGGQWYFYNNAGTWEETPATLAAILTELTNIRNFVGKSGAGVEDPTFTPGLVIDNPTTTNLEQAVDELNIEIGADFVDQGVITTANTVQANLVALDTAISSLGAGVVGTGTGITAAAAIDAFNIQSFVKVEWEIFVRLDSDNTRTQVITGTAHHNGTLTVDATARRVTTRAGARTGTKITTLDFTAVLAGTGAAQTLTLNVASLGAAISYSFRRTDTLAQF